jgi:hypothetical protein
MSEIPDALATYLAARDHTRADQIADAFAALTPREKSLVWEAAVMGYVQGTQARHPAVPADSVIVADVIGACIAMPDLYPAIAGETR